MTEQEIGQYQQKLVETLKENGSLTTSQVEQAFLIVPRHLFLPGEPPEKVYSDIAIAVRRGAEGRWTSSSSQPAIMAIMLEQLDLQPGQRVLEIGTGSGFNAALIAAIVGPTGKVITIDIQPDLIEEARQHLEAAGYARVQTVAGDGGYGFPEGAPYDRIILTVGSAILAPAWREQLVEGGRLVLPLGSGWQKSVAFERRGEELVSVSMQDCGFMMLQGAFAPPPPIRTQIGPDPRLFISSDKAIPADGERLAGWLNEPVQDRPTGVIIKLEEILAGLSTWLGVRLPGLASLTATGDLADQDTIPQVMGFGGEWKSVNTMILVEAEGAGALARPPGVKAPLEDLNRLGEQIERFELHVRQLGPNPETARRMLQAVREWEQAARPGTARMRLRALPAAKEYTLKEGEYLLDTRYTTLVLSYLPE
jgi:protein-L-isoaspartate(D-aspartate) O-methyltransferase